MAYLGNSPLNRLFNIQAITLSQGQVNVNVAYTPGMVLFFKNGALLIPNTDYTATNGSVLTLAKAANAGDVIQGINLASYAVADAVPLSGGTVGGLLTGPASASESVAGLVKLATAVIAQGFMNDTDVLTSKTLADAFKGANAQLNQTSGWTKLPNGLIVQWLSVVSTHTVSAYNLPIPFPNAAWLSWATGQTAWDNLTDASVFCETFFVGKTQVGVKGVRADGTVGTRGVSILAIGI